MATARIDPAHAHRQVDARHWRIVDGAIQGTFTTGDFATGLRFVARIGEAAETADHHPDIDLRYSRVQVRLLSHDVGGLTERDIALATVISGIADELRLDADLA